MKYSIFGAALLSSAVHAWLPADRDLGAFNATRFTSVDKRFEPTLPNGVNKIRGVNFGGKSDVLLLKTVTNQLT